MDLTKIVLASKSERRKEILGIYLKDFIVGESDSMEAYNDKFNLYTNTMSISKDKVASLKNNYEDSIIIGADTVVVLDNEIMGKAKDKNEGKKFLKKLSGREHKVVTSFYISYLEKNIKILDYVESKVIFYELDDETIDEYIKTGEWEGKAGAYAIQGKAATFIKSIEGDYLNIVGLPISKISMYLKKYLDVDLLRLGNDI